MTPKRAFPTSYVLIVDEAYFSREIVFNHHKAHLWVDEKPHGYPTSLFSAGWSLLAVSTSNICRLSHLFASAATKLI
ncbi:hypothetical protein TNCV_1458051 [Trichonephila clavipes]|nr:hypothetical protein TNCV_1458051 [Trichonephila clavipes]